MKSEWKSVKRIISVLRTNQKKIVFFYYFLLVDNLDELVAVLLVLSTKLHILKPVRIMPWPGRMFARL